MDVNSVGSIASKVDYPLPPVDNVAQVNQTQPISGPDLPRESVRLSLSPAAQKILKNNADSGRVAKSNNLQCQAGYKLKLSADQLGMISKLQMNDLRVRNHEQIHLSIAGAFAVSGANYHFATGPDGKQYAVAGEVKIDTSPVRNNPEATIKKAQTVRAAALAPPDPSGADRSVAATASSMEIKARNELSEKLSKDMTTEKSSLPGSGEKEKAARKYKAYFNSGKTWPLGNLINGLA